MAPSKPRLESRWLLVCLLISGASALIYQVAWTREFRLIFGGTATAAACVLAIFMGGIGIGNALIGRYADRARQPILWYVRIELAILTWAALSPWGMDGIRAIYITLGGQSELGEFTNLVRIGLGTLVLLVPAILMGSTLPLIACALVNAQDASRTALGRLYGVNTSGAVLGTLFANFWALSELGTRLTLWLACSFNLIAVGIAWWVNGRAIELNESLVGRAAAKPLSQNEEVTSPWLVYALCCGVGFVFFSMELVWFRMLGPLLGGTTYTFGLILAIALTGIGAGSLVYPRWFSKKRPTLLAVSLTCLCEAIAIGVPLVCGDRIAFWAFDLQPLEPSFAHHIFGWSIICGIVVLPASMIAGFQFPLLMALLGSGKSNVGAHVGVASGMNTLGAVIGSMATGFYLLPTMGAVGLWRFNVYLLILFASGAYAKWVLSASVGSPRTVLLRRRVFQVIFGSVLIAVLVVVIQKSGPTAVWRHAGIGAGRSGLAGNMTSRDREDWARTIRRRTRSETEGVEACVAMQADDSWSFVINGKTDGNAVSDAGTQIMLGLLGAILHPEPHRALVVGLGTGETAGWLGDVEGIEHVDVIEIEPALMDVAHACTDINQQVMQNSKVQVIFEDARERLLTSHSRYELIISEPSNPYRAGIANLFTAEFYRACRQSLTNDGVFVQWLQAYEIDWETVLTVLSTLRSEFGSVEVWQSKSDDLLLVCHPERTDYSLRNVSASLRQATIAKGLFAAWRVESEEDFWARFLLNPEGVERLVSGFEVINTDDHNRIEFGFARTLGRASDFDLREISARAIAEKTHLPRLSDGSLDGMVVCEYRQIMFQSADANRFRFADMKMQHQRRAVLMEHYWKGDFQSMTRQATDWDWQPKNYVEKLILATSAALGGTELSESTISDIRRASPSDASMLLAIRYYGRQEYDKAAEQIVATCHALRQDPWMFKHLRHAIYDLAVITFQQVPEKQLELYRAFQEPFAVHVLEDDRRRLLCEFGRQLNPRFFVEAMEPMEPNIPLNEALLKARSQVYDSIKHSSASKAKDDLRWFRSSP